MMMSSKGHWPKSTSISLLQLRCQRPWPLTKSKQAEQKSSHDRHAKTRGWFVGQCVMARNVWHAGPNWVLATVLEVLGRVSYIWYIYINWWQTNLEVPCRSVETMIYNTKTVNWVSGNSSLRVRTRVHYCSQCFRCNNNIIIIIVSRLLLVVHQETIPRYPRHVRSPPDRFERWHGTATFFCMEH